MGIIQSIIIKLKKEKFKSLFLSIGGAPVLVAMDMEITALLVEQRKLEWAIIVGVGKKQIFL